jgi:hypothetical protein
MSVFTEGGPERYVILFLYEVERINGEILEKGEQSSATAVEC